ncbi:MAG TPA: hypothetical protein VJA45_03715 [Methylomirabilota bacterium]|nr:hypothetical protein [Methylomirabilota bacterium]
MSAHVGSLAVLAVALGCVTGQAWAQVGAERLADRILLAQRPAGPLPMPPAGPQEPRGSGAPHRSGELECRNCHEATHQGVARMYLGMGGRGTPMIPSHMFQVRVECVACHTLPKQEGAVAKIAGQTFRPTEQACVNCHSEKYRGMLQRWLDTLVKMREVVAPKLEAARTALINADPKNPKHARAKALAGDAEFNMEFVTFGKGIHNVFYAADLLKLSNSWLDEALALLGRPPVKGDDTLVRGGYCAVLCHEQAGVKQLETVTYRKQKIPHVRHVTEFGATCTACHSAEVHKAVTATPAACSACHHGPQNERCESCHRRQSAFYQGQEKTDLITLEPNAMVNAVACTGCHDWSRKHSRQAVGEKCVGCHDPAYTSFMSAWTIGLDKEAMVARDALKRAEVALARRRRAGRPDSDADTLVREAREALALVQKARAVHNPPAAEALLQLARKKAEEALVRSAQR